MEENVSRVLVTSSYIDDPSRFQMHQARAEEITLKEDFISVPMPMDDDFGNSTGANRSDSNGIAHRSLGDANGMEEPEFFRKLQPSLHLNAQNSNMDLDSTTIATTTIISPPCCSLDTNIRKDHSIARPFGDDPFALDGFGDRTFRELHRTLSFAFSSGRACLSDRHRRQGSLRSRYVTISP